MKTTKIAAFALGPIVAAAFGFLTMPLLAWLFSAEDIGRLNIANVAMGFGLLALTLGLDQAYVREYHDSKNRGALLRKCVRPGLILLAVTIIFSTIFRTQLSEALFGIQSGHYTVILLACISASFLTRFLALVLRMEERGLAFSMSQIMPKLVFLAAVILVLLMGLEPTFLVLLMSTCLSLIMVMVVFAWLTRGSYPRTPSRTKSPSTASLARYGTPLAFAGIAYWALNSSSVIILRVTSELSEIGIYAVAVSTAGIAMIFQSIISTVWAPIVFRWQSQNVDMSRIKRVSALATAVASGLVCLVGAFSWCLPLILPTAYGGVGPLMVTAMIPAILYTLSEVTSVGINLSRKTAWALVASVVAALLNILLGYLLIPSFGATGAVVSNAFAFLLFFVFRTEVAIRVWRPAPRMGIYLSMGLVTFSAIIFALFQPATVFTLPLWGLVGLGVASIWRSEYAELLSRALQIVRARRQSRSGQRD